ncbi:hypothetical protein SeMB42_g07174 [Synchytrium endobioticum]|uniref:Uncharacterized protein n=1 Tax=Synchytrium endobioticum TaxID=286115 RepID=A0A507C720_9FUNG|nr:hypothetical protein SeMB42_g07174 [Synchytrium endobioticum]
MHPWTTADFSPEERVVWLRNTDVSLIYGAPVTVTDEEVRGAFTLTDKIRKKIRKLSSSFHNLTFNLRRRAQSMSNVPPPPEALQRNKNIGSSEGESPTAILTGRASAASPSLPSPSGWSHHTYNCSGSNLLSSLSHGIADSRIPTTTFMGNGAPDEGQSDGYIAPLLERKPDLASTLPLLTEDPCSHNVPSNFSSPSTPSALSLNVNASRLHSPVKIHSPLSFAEVLNAGSANTHHQNPAPGVDDDDDNEAEEEGARQERERIMMWEKEQGIGIDEDYDEVADNP